MRWTFWCYDCKICFFQSVDITMNLINDNNDIEIKLAFFRWIFRYINFINPASFPSSPYLRPLAQKILSLQSSILPSIWSHRKFRNKTHTNVVIDGKSFNVSHLSVYMWRFDNVVCTKKKRKKYTKDLVSIRTLVDTKNSYI